MIECPACSAPSVEASRYCSQCGLALAGARGVDACSRSSAKSRETPAQALPAENDLSLEALAPGAVLLKRYRIVGLLGRGGMGHVYRADDLKVDQAVALKFLPAELSRDDAWLRRFHTEVRIARQISHPNVCHVYDIGEVEGRHFISMEFVRGEDLSSLLRQIGRLPQKKAVEIALQLCGGLSAVHSRRVLHRDLKPANIMIDDEGAVRLTDFGLADLVDRPDGACVGTPNYMAPEILRGSPATVRSDLYSLGLVLYEMFTGKQVFESDSLPELLRLQKESTPVRPSTVFEDCDLRVERVLMACLEKDPSRRPSSVLEVISALPGGDALAQALSVGETPSPDVVAAAGDLGFLRPRAALICLLGQVVLLAMVVLLASRATLIPRIDPGKPPEVLADRAEGLLRRLGIAEGSVDSAFGFEYDWDVVRYLERTSKEDREWGRLETGHPAPLRFWYRVSPRFLRSNDVFAGGRVSHSDPPHASAEMATAVLDAEGRLLELSVVPPRRSSGGASLEGEVEACDWSALFAAAGLRREHFSPRSPRWTPPVHADERRAWVRSAPGVGEEDGELRVEAACFDGMPVYFEVFGPWSGGGGAESPAWMAALGGRRRVFETLSLLLFAELMVAGLFLAVRNLRSGRGDRRGAFRLAAWVFSVRMIAWALQASHVPEFSGELHLFATALGRALYPSAILWILYVALEPYVRQLWPRVMISWTRLLTGQLRDPLVGRDVLVGGLVGVVWALLFQLDNLAPTWFGMPQPAPLPGSVAGLQGVGPLLGDFLASQPGTIFRGLSFLLLLLLLRVVSRRRRLAAGIFFVLVTALHSLLSSTPSIGWVFSALGSLFLLLILLRLGVLAAVVALSVCFVLLRYPLTSDLSSWYASSSVLVCGLVLCLGIFGFLTSLAGRPILRDALFD